MQPFSRFARYFIVVARSGSLRRAAEELHVSASAINRQILLAEQQCEAPLFERLPQGLRLTAAGEYLLNDLQRWQKDHERLLERFAELRGAKRGHVTIALIEALGEGLLPATLARLRPQHPNLSFDLRVLPNSQIAQQLLALEVDIGLLLDPHLQRELDCRASIQFPIGLVTRPDHFLAGKPDLKLSDLVGLRQILPAATLRIAELTRDMTGVNAGTPVEHITSNNIRLIRSLLASGDEIAILSQLDVLADLQGGKLVFTPIGGGHLKPLTLGVVVAPHRQLSRAAQAVLAALTEELSTASWVS